MQNSSLIYLLKFNRVKEFVANCVVTDVIANSVVNVFINAVMNAIIKTRIKAVFAMFLFLFASVINASNLVNLSFTNHPEQASLTLTFDQSVTPKLSMDKNALTLNIELNAKNTLQGLPVNFSGDNLMSALRAGKNKGSDSSSLIVDLRNTSQARFDTQNKGNQSVVLVTINKVFEQGNNNAEPVDPLGEFIAKQSVPDKKTKSSSASSSTTNITSDTKTVKSQSGAKENKTPTDLAKKSDQTASNPTESKKNDKTKNADAVANNRPPLKNSGRIVIAIDAGHGGKDPGAIGQAGNKEKVIALAVSKKLEQLLRNDPMFTPVLTRTGDYYISVPARSEIARKQKANLLVSIHADAAPNKQARGASVWVLSNKRANTEMAGWLEKQEKQSELLGGAGDVLSGNEKDKYLSQAVLDLQFGHSQKVGYGAAQEVLKELGNIGKLHKKRPEHASLGVLRSPDIPSMLIEIGFISHPDEERQLASAAYQDQLAKSIYKGLKRYFQQHPQTVK